LRFELVDVKPDASFSSEARLPGAQLRFDHVIDPRETGSRITHRVTLDGPLAFLYTRRVRKGVERGLPVAAPGRVTGSRFDPHLHPPGPVPAPPLAG